MKGLLIALVVLVLIAVLLGGPIIGAKNEFVTQKNDIDGKYAQVDNAMKRRADLIPNLVETVKGYAKQEKGVFDDIANARAGMLNAHTPEESNAANNQVQGAIGRLLLLQENYPQLKSDAQFMRLQDELAGAENRIAIARKDYNEAVQKYNTNIELFPKSIAASLFGYHRNDAYFKTTDEEKKTPQVKF
jgi:LemA protein